MLVSPRSNDELLAVSLEGRTDFAVDLVELSLEQSEVLVVYRYLIFGHCDMIERISSTCVKVESRSGKRSQTVDVEVAEAAPYRLCNVKDRTVASEQDRCDRCSSSPMSSEGLQVCSL